MFHIHFAVFQIFKPLIFPLLFISVHYRLNFFIIPFTKLSKFKLILFTLSHSNLFQYVTKNNPKYKKRASRDFFEKGRSETMSLRTEQLQKKAAQSTVSKFSQMLSNSN